MDVGIQMIFAGAGYDGVSDSQVYKEDLELALRAEELGFDAVWPVEHHFYDYSMCPDNLEMLAYIAGKTSTIGLGTAAIILPWNDPLRVAEKVAMLDEISDGRVRMGFGRGLSRREYAHFRGIEMDEARGRFDEAAKLIVDALETGYMEGDGEFYPTPRTQLRPAPTRSFRGRTYSVAGSADSISICAEIGARMVMFSEKRWENRLPGLNEYRDAYQAKFGEAAPPPMTADFVVCDPDPELAKELAVEHMTAYLMSILDHYELFSDHFKDIKGYRGYGKQSDLLNKIGVEGYVKGFLGANAFGTPDQILEHFKERRDVLGEYELATCFRFGGLPFDRARSSFELFAAEVLPELKRW
ncbi:MAG: LLM class flavin-dependent oxidoreductase [Acidimicrobiia bacterium]|nr:LLM class flavin-dependent oxidoreductase [Acidimicrobiia bacterium]